LGSKDFLGAADLKRMARVRRYISRGTTGKSSRDDELTAFGQLVPAAGSLGAVELALAGFGAGNRFAHLRSLS
jgi:hypothetical protein